MQANSKSTMQFLAIAIIALLSLIVWLVPAIPQDPAYHNFADTRKITGINNFWNVASNLPFILAGGYGLANMSALEPQLRTFTRIYSGGLILICFGSSWYHLAPDNASLVWDRLSMTISFMAFFAFILSRLISLQTGIRILWPLIGLGLFSVVYWSLTERAGTGDLRLYGVVQFLPALLIPIFLLAFPQRFVPESRSLLWLGVAAYLAAKFAEWQDQAIYDWSIILSGHSLKHLLAALSSYYFVRVLLVTRDRI